MPSYRSRVLGAISNLDISHCSAQAPTVNRERFGSTYAPVIFECPTVARNRSASALVSNAFECRWPLGS